MSTIKINAAPLTTEKIGGRTKWSPSTGLSRARTGSVVFSRYNSMLAGIFTLMGVFALTPAFMLLMDTTIEMLTSYLPKDLKQRIRGVHYRSRGLWRFMIMANLIIVAGPLMCPKLSYVAGKRKPVYRQKTPTHQFWMKLEDYGEMAAYELLVEDRDEMCVSGFLKSLRQEGGTGAIGTAAGLYLEELKDSDKVNIGSLTKWLNDNSVAYVVVVSGESSNEQVLKWSGKSRSIKAVIFDSPYSAYKQPFVTFHKSVAEGNTYEWDDVDGKPVGHISYVREIKKKEFSKEYSDAMAYTMAQSKASKWRQKSTDVVQETLVQPQVARSTVIIPQRKAPAPPVEPIRPAPPIPLIKEIALKTIADSSNSTSVARVAPSYGSISNTHIITDRQVVKAPDTPRVSNILLPPPRYEMPIIQGCPTLTPIPIIAPVVTCTSTVPIATRVCEDVSIVKISAARLSHIILPNPAKSTTNSVPNTTPLARRICENVSIVSIKCVPIRKEKEPPKYPSWFQPNDPTRPALWESYDIPKGKAKRNKAALPIFRLGTAPRLLPPRYRRAELEEQQVAARTLLYNLPPRPIQSYVVTSRLESTPIVTTIPMPVYHYVPCLYPIHAAIPRDTLEMCRAKLSREQDSSVNQGVESVIDSSMAGKFLPLSQKFLNHNLVQPVNPPVVPPVAPLVAPLYAAGPMPGHHAPLAAPVVAAFGAVAAMAIPILGHAHLLRVSNNMRHKYGKYIGWGMSLKRHGLYENADKIICSRSTEVTPHHDVHRFLGFDTEITLPSKVREIWANFRSKVPDRVGFGGKKAWRTRGDTSAGCLIYYECGPLNAKTAWKVWEKFSGNSTDRPLGILWTHTSDYADYTTDRFTFPNWADNDGKYYYSWEEVPVTGAIAYITDDDYRAKHVPTGAAVHHYGQAELWIPVRQSINAKITPVIPTMGEFEIHIHTDSRDATNVKTSKHYCRANCLTQDWGEIFLTNSGTHGLSETEFKGCLATLGTYETQSARHAQVVKYLSSALSVSFNSPAVLQEYATSLLLYASATQYAVANPDTLATVTTKHNLMHNVVHRRMAGTVGVANELFVAGRRRKKVVTYRSIPYQAEDGAWETLTVLETLIKVLRTIVKDNKPYSEITIGKIEALEREVHARIRDLVKFVIDNEIELESLWWTWRILPSIMKVADWSKNQKIVVDNIMAAIQLPKIYQNAIVAVSPIDNYVQTAGVWVKPVLDNRRSRLGHSGAVYNAWILSLLLRYVFPVADVAYLVGSFMDFRDIRYLACYDLNTRLIEEAVGHISRKVEQKKAALEGLLDCQLLIRKHMDFLTHRELDLPYAVRNTLYPSLLRPDLHLTIDSESLSFSSQLRFMRQLDREDLTFGRARLSDRVICTSPLDVVFTRPLGLTWGRSTPFHRKILTTVFNRLDGQDWQMESDLMPWNMDFIIKSSLEVCKAVDASVESHEYFLIKNTIRSGNLQSGTSLGLTSLYLNYGSVSEDMIGIMKPRFLTYSEFEIRWDDWLKQIDYRNSDQERHIAGPRTKGRAISKQEWDIMSEPKSKRLCSMCFGHAPRKWKWPAGICVTCRENMMNMDLDERCHVACKNLHWDGPTLTQFQRPVLLAPANPAYKDKPLIPNLKIDDDFGKGVGWKQPLKVRPKMYSQPSQLIGPSYRTMARVYDLKSADIEVETLKRRAFALTPANPTLKNYENLWCFLQKIKFFGPQDSWLAHGATPFCVYNFHEDGPVAIELRRLNIATDTTILGLLKLAKRNVDAINALVWKIPMADWLNKEKTCTWIGEFDARKKARYWNALLDYKADAENDLTRIRFSMFLKRELANSGTFINGYRERANPRIIFDPPPITQVFMGPILRPATKLLHQTLPDTGNITYFGGTDPDQANRWIRKYVTPDYQFSFNDPKFNLETGSFVSAIENDISKMDCSYSEPCFWFVKQVYNWWGIEVNNQYIEKILESWEQPVGRFRSGLKVRAPTMNASGRADTALMNALVNASIQLGAYVSSFYQKPIELVTEYEYECFTKRFAMGLLGDDSIVFTQTRENTANDVQQYMASLGFEAAGTKYWRTPHHITFLGQRVYPVLERGRPTIAWGPSIGRRLYKFGVSCDVQVNPYKWLKQVMLASEIMAAHVPIIHEIAKKELSLLEHIRITTDELEEYIRSEPKLKYKFFMTSSSKLVSDPERIWDWLNIVYGIGPEDIAELNSDLSRVTRPTIILNYPFLDRMVRLDTG